MGDVAKSQVQDKSKQYESKLAALNAINSALQKENEKLRRDAARQPLTDAEEELEELRHEFQARLGQSDRTIAALQDDKAKLAAALSSAQAGQQAAEARIAELQATIDTLNHEGERLSRKAGDAEAALRKLRAAHKETEADRDKLQARVKALESQVIDLQGTAEGAAHATRQQMEALQLELSQVRLESKKAVAEANRQAQEGQLRAEAEAARGGAELVAAAKEREAALVAQVSELREALLASSTEAASKEQTLRKQLQRLEERNRDLEAERSDLSAHAGDATQPLLKQIDSMAQQAAAAAAAARYAEQSLMARLEDAELMAAEAAKAERAAMGRAAAAEAAAASAAEAASVAIARAAETEGLLQAEQRAAKAMEAEKLACEERLAAAVAVAEKARAEVEAVRKELHEKLWDAEQRIRTLELERDELLQRVEAWSQHNTRTSQSGLHNSRSSMHVSQPGSLNSNEGQQGIAAQQQASGHPPQHSSPTPQPQQSQQASTGRQAQSTASPMHDGIEAAQNPGVSSADRLSGREVAAVGLSEADASELDILLKNFTDAAAAAVAAEQRQRPSQGGFLTGFMLLKPATAISKVDTATLVRTVELLQKRLRAAERERDLAAQQMFSLMNDASNQQQDVQAAQELRQKLAEMAHRCDVALELLGERNEHIEQLEEDIADMRAIFHQQLEAAVEQLNAANLELAKLRAAVPVLDEVQGQEPGGSNSKVGLNGHAGVRPGAASNKQL